MRVLDFADGFSSSAAPSTIGGVIPAVTGTRAAPISIVAVTGVVPAGYAEEWIFVQGSGGAVTVSANPQITAGTIVGQKIRLIGRDDTNTVTLADGTGMLLNGPVTLGAGSVIDLGWDGTNWFESGRSGDK